jgi:hypothetical protein
MTSQAMESKKRAARSDDSEFPPETSKVFTTGLQPQTNFDKARAVPTLKIPFPTHFPVSPPDQRCRMFKDRQQCLVEIKKVTNRIIQK